MYNTGEGYTTESMPERKQVDQLKQDINAKTPSIGSNADQNINMVLMMQWNGWNQPSPCDNDK
jgi:hypothetical protein